jgi:hypothetical protein
VRVLQYRVVGTVCQDGWDNNDAKVLCHQNGYLDGQVFGTIKLLSQSDPIWLTEVSCKGNEDNITQCDVLMNTTHRCSSKVQPAGVICYNGTGNNYDKYRCCCQLLPLLNVDITSSNDWYVFQMFSFVCPC